MRKRIIRSVSLILAAVMVLAFTPRVFAESDPIVDFDGNGKTTSDDAVYLLRYTLFPDAYPIEDFADFDGNGRITSDDAVYLLRYTLFPDAYPIERVAYERGSVHLSELIYERPDFETAFAAIQTGMTALETHSLSEDGMLDVLNTVDSVYAECGGNSDLLYFLLARDVTDSELQKENAFFTNARSELYSEYLELLAGAIDDPVYGALFEDWSDEDKQQIKDFEAVTDEEYVALNDRFTELYMMYNDIFSCVVEVNGEKVVLGEIQDEALLEQEYLKLCGEIYTGIISVMKSLALKEGYDDVLEYMYYSRHGRDFSPDDVRNMHKYVKQYIAPMFGNAFEEYLGALSYLSLEDGVYCYDEYLREYFASISSSMLQAYDYIKEFGLCYATDSSDSIDGAFTFYAGKYDAPVIYQRVEGTADDLNTFIHEFGHFYNFYLHGADAADQLDICEIHSQANELLFLPVYKEIFGDKIGDMIQKDRLVLAMYYLIQASIFSEFEIKAFEGDYGSAEELCDLFAGITAEYGMEDFFPPEIWTEVRHFFDTPHYYVSYGTSLVPALQIYSAFTEDSYEGIWLYNYVTEFGDDDVWFLELLDCSGLGSPFEESVFIDLAQMFSVYFPE